YLADRRMLLVLDNCEHLLDACAVLVDTLLQACPHLRFLATSRQPLGIAGETTFRVPSLGLPDADLRPSTTAWRACEAVALFEDRATAVDPLFASSDGNAAAIVDLCRRLDGVPLAIELAAVWVRTITVPQIVERLADRFRLLS